jgi:hypothetical protein
MITRRQFGIGAVMAAASGDGLRRPLNAPAAGSVGTGVQPGTQNPVVLARYVIVSGAGGGVFLYVGTPALGNPPIEYMSLSTTDPYGNTLPGTGIVSNSSGIGVQLNNGILSFTDGSGTHLGNMTITNSPAGSGNAIEIGLSDFYDQNNLYVGGVTSAIDPANIPSAETWHAMALTGGWTGTGQYKLMPDGTVMIRTSGGSLAAGTITSGTVIWTAPAGYRPASTQQSIPLVISAVGGGSVAAAVDPFLLITNTGALSVNNISAQVATNVRFCGSYALD